MKQRTIGNKNYLDVNITKTKNNIFETKVYRKPGSGKEIIHSRCRIPYGYKITSLKSYINNALIICSNKKLVNEELRIIEEVARNNGYNKEMVQKIYKKNKNT